MEENRFFDTTYKALADVENFLSGQKVVGEFVDSSINAKPIEKNSEGEKILYINMELSINTELYEKIGLDLPEKTSVNETYRISLDNEETPSITYGEFLEALSGDTILEFDTESSYESVCHADRNIRKMPRGKIHI